MYSLRKLYRTILGTLGILVPALTTAAGTGVPLPPVDDPRALTIYQVMVASFRHGQGGAPGYTAMWGPDGHV